MRPCLACIASKRPFATLTLGRQSMKILLWIHGLFEGAFALAAIAAPQEVWPAGDALARANGRVFGFAALTASVLGVLAARRTSEPVIGWLALRTLSVWHVGVAVGLGLVTAQGLGPPPPAVIHCLFAVAFIVVTLRQRGAGAPAGS
jgi:hypothetical protein